MALKFFVLAGFLILSRGGVVSASNAVIASPVFAKISEDTYDPLPQYTFGYDVRDALTGDSKSQIESRNGDVVLGQYSLNDPDGTRRIVDYASDPINGFNAIVRRAPLAIATPVVAPVATPVGAPEAPVVVEPVVARAAVGPVAQPAVARAANAPVGVRIASATNKINQAAPAQARSVPATPAPDTASARTAPPAGAAARTAPAASPIRATIAGPILAYSGLLAPLAYNLW